MKKDKKIKIITGEEFDELFDSGSDEIDNYVNYQNPMNRDEFFKMIKKSKKKN